VIIGQRYRTHEQRKLCKSAPDAPPAPNYVGAAQATSQGNLDAARAAASANRVDQITPYGNLTYSQNPGAGPDGGWQATTTLAPAQQTLLSQQNQTSIGLGNLEQQGLGYVANAVNNTPTMASLPANMVNPGQTGQDAIMARLQPQIDQSNKALQTQLANQGIAQGSEAYGNAMRVQQQGVNDQYQQAALAGIGVGQNAQNQQLQLQTALQNQPVNMLNAVRTGSQVTNPTFNSVPQQATTSGADLLGATTAQGNYNQGLYGSQVAQTNSANSSTYSAAATAATLATMF
jgi:hypothetical protein